MAFQAVASGSGQSAAVVDVYAITHSDCDVMRASIDCQRFSIIYPILSLCILPAQEHLRRSLLS